VAREQIQQDLGEQMEEYEAAVFSTLMAKG